MRKNLDSINENLIEQLNKVENIEMKITNFITDQGKIIT